MKKAAIALSFAVLIFDLGLAAAYADTVTEQVTFSSLPAVQTGDVSGDSDKFAGFNPSLGTLTSITLNIDEVVTAPPSQTLDLTNLQVLISDLFCTAFEIVPSGSTMNYSCSGSTNEISDLAEFTDKSELTMQYGFGGDSGSVLDSLSGSVVYTYTPAPTPEPSSLILFGTGIVGMAGFAVRGYPAWRRS